MGPWRPIANGSLARNPYSWTRYASMVFLEQPAGVGFSFTTNKETLKRYNDYRASSDNLLILSSFFQKFPERKENRFYLASESYGGHYIPQWTLQLLNLSPSSSSSSDLLSRFQGFLVGNPFTSFASGTLAFVNILWGLQLVPATAW
jgi:carboxypeptidase C (cathepsin A)